jgi:hypothetical protein
MKPAHLAHLAVACFVVCGAASAWAEAGIYTCVDAKGRRLTSDRPIFECLDREQKELTPNGNVKRILKPALSAEEQAALDEKNRRMADERARVAEEKRRSLALLARYPDRATHDREREQALQAVQDVMAVADHRIVELEDEARKLAGQAEFYRSGKSKMPPTLNRDIEQNAQTIAAQKRFIANQEQEKQRINAHFDEELAKLKPLWVEHKAAATAAAASRSQRQ